MPPFRLPRQRPRATTAQEFWRARLTAADPLLVRYYLKPFKRHPKTFALDLLGVEPKRPLRH